MDLKEKHEHRLALLSAVELSQEELNAILNEIDDMERVVAELEEFAKDTPWISLQAQPAFPKDDR